MTGLLRAFLAPEREFYIGVARAFGGAILFALPLFMTMEMWWLGFVTQPQRLALFLLTGFVLLWPLAWLAGFRDDVSWRDALIDAGVAYLIAVLAATAVLALLAVITPGMSAYEMLGKIAVQSVPASMGAVLARSQLGVRDNKGETERRRSFFSSELFLMAAGALFLAFNVAPTEEILLIVHQQSHPLYLLATMLTSIAIMHGFVYAIGFRGQHAPSAGRSGALEFLTLTVPGYVLVLLVCLYVLWTFGRLDGTSPAVTRDLVLVLSFPGAIGAATARLVL